MARNKGPDRIPNSLRQRRGTRTGHVAVLRPIGMPTLAAVAFLIGLGSPPVDDHSLSRIGDVADIEPCQFRTAKGTGKTDENQGAVPGSRKAIRAVRDNPLNIGSKETLLAMLCRADRAPNSFEGFAYDEVMGRSRGIFAASGLMGLARGEFLALLVTLVRSHTTER